MTYVDMVRSLSASREKERPFSSKIRIKDPLPHFRKPRKSRANNTIEVEDGPGVVSPHLKDWLYESKHKIASSSSRGKLHQERLSSTGSMKRLTIPN